MSKTAETLELERRLYRNTIKTGTFGCFEITIGWYGKERVDYMTYDTKGIWRCYEIKTSKKDFFSSAHLTFVGHYNYFVMPDRLYQQVKDHIPDHIGVHDGNYVIKKPKRQELGVDEKVLKDSFIRSLSREFEKSYRSQDNKLIENLRHRIREGDKLNNSLTELVRKLYNNRHDLQTTLLDMQNALNDCRLDYLRELLNHANDLMRD